MRRLLCKLGIHRWRRDYTYPPFLGVYFCTRCNKTKTETTYL